VKVVREVEGAVLSCKEISPACEVGDFGEEVCLQDMSFEVFNF